MENTLYTVLTGDIVKSSRLSPADLRRLPEVLTTIFQSIDPVCKPAGFATRYSIFRGDSFQLICEPACALKAWLIIRAGLRSNYPAPLSRSVDARIGIAVGKVDHLAGNITESSGEAFNLSGRLIETLKAPHLTAFTSGNSQTNRNLNIDLMFADDILRRWTTSQCRIVPFLLQSLNQSEIAKATKTRQPTVAAKVTAMGWNAFEHWMNYYIALTGESGSFTAP